MKLLNYYLQLSEYLLSRANIITSWETPFFYEKVTRITKLLSFLLYVIDVKEDLSCGWWMLDEDEYFEGEVTRVHACVRLDKKE